MNKRKKSGKAQPDSMVNLATALLNLIVALILLYEKLTS